MTLPIIRLMENDRFYRLPDFEYYQHKFWIEAEGDEDTTLFVGTDTPKFSDGCGHGPGSFLFHKGRHDWYIFKGSGGYSFCARYGNRLAEYRSGAQYTNVTLTMQGIQKYFDRPF